MAKQFTLPDLGYGIREARIVGINIAEGDTVECGQVVMDLENEVSVVHLPVPFGGIASKVHVREGDTVAVGQVLLELTDAQDLAADTNDADASTTSLSRDIKVRMSDEAGGADVSVAVNRPHTRAQHDDSGPVPATPAIRRLAREFEVDLRGIDGSGPDGRIIREDVERHRLSQNAFADATDRTFRADDQTDTPAPSTEDQPPSSEQTAEASDACGGPTADTGRDVAECACDSTTMKDPVDLTTAPDPDHVTTMKEPADVLTADGAAVPSIPTEEPIEQIRLNEPGILTPTLAAAAPSSAPTTIVPAEADESQHASAIEAQAPDATVNAAPDALLDFSQWGSIRREPIPEARRAIAQQTAEAWTRIPHVSTSADVDITDLEAFRAEQGKVFTERGAGLSLTAFILKAVAGALRNCPRFNASYDEAAEEVIYKDYVHIGVVVQTPDGPMTPILRDVDSKALTTVSKELAEMTQRASEAEIEIAETRGGTFTVTSIGTQQGTVTTAPIIHWPEVAILGVGPATTRPVVRDGEIVVRKMLPLTTSIDGRVIDTTESVQFLGAIADYLENPLNLLLVS